MNEKIFDIKLTVLTPIHIGSAESYNPIDYDIDYDYNELHIIDHDKFIQKINSNKILYNDFLSRIQKFSLKDSSFIKFIREQSKGLYKYSVKIDDKALSYINKKPNEIERAPIEKFIKNAHDDTVYIPGSSIKGALRTTIIEIIFKRLLKEEEKENKCEDSKNRQYLLKILKENDKLNQKDPKPEIVLNENFKYNDAQNDILKYVFVSDFYPEEANLEICFPINKDKNGKENDIPVLLECVMPKSVFQGKIRIKEEFFDKLNSILKKISKEVDNKITTKPFEKDYKIDEFSNIKLAAWFRTNFIPVYECEKKNNHCNNNTNLSNGIKTNSNLFLLKIGKHAGALSKSIAGLRKIAVKNNVSSSQTTFWYIDGQPMGWIKGEVTLA